MEKASKALDTTENFFMFITSILIIFATGSIILEVIIRMLFNISFSWVHEINEYILLFIPFLTAAWIHRYKEHIVIDLLEEVLPLRVKYVLDIIIILIGIFVSAMLVWYGTVVTMDYIEHGVRSQTNLKVPRAYISMVIPLGSFLLLLEFIRSLYRRVIAKT